MDLGKGRRGQNPGRNTVLLAGRSLTHSGLCGLDLLGRSLLGFWGGPSRIARDKLGQHGPGEGSRGQNPGRGAVPLAGGSLTHSGWYGLNLTCFLLAFFFPIFISVFSSDIFASNCILLEYFAFTLF